MTKHRVGNDYELNLALNALKRRRIPFVLEITDGKARTDKQNRLQRKWMLELESQGDMTAEEYRGSCKAWFGIPILLAENEIFAEEYNKTIRPLPFETKIRLMQAPFDFAVTRLMTTKQKGQYLDKIFETYTSQGFILTEPKNNDKK